MTTGDDFRDHIAALLGTRYDNVRSEIQLRAKKADICFETRFGALRIKVAVECKKWERSLTRDDVKDILADYDPARQDRQIDQIWIVCNRTPAPGAREFVGGYQHAQLMTALELERSIIDFGPMLNILVKEFENDALSQYFILPKYYSGPDQRAALHDHISAWLADDAARPIAIWGGYGMGKTSYARYLAATLARTCLDEYGSRIPILLSLGDFTTAPNIETLIFSQLTNFYGIRDFSIGAFRLLNRQHRFVLILDGVDEMKFAMAQNEFAYFAAELRKSGKDNPKLLILGRPDVLVSEDDASRLLTSKIESYGHAVKADDAPDFENVRLAFFAKDEYLALIRNFLRQEIKGTGAEQRIGAIVDTIAGVALEDILERPVQSKMLAEIVNEPGSNLAKMSRFTLYDLFIKKILRREEEKSARRHLSSSDRLQFMRQLAWWLWTDKKTRTFTAMEIPTELIQRFEPSDGKIPLEGLRRELLVGSLVEERHTGHFLSEKAGGVFYFPHNTFAEFLVADYIMSQDFLTFDAKRLPEALYGVVPSFLREHPSGDAMLYAYDKIKAASVSMNTASISVILNEVGIRSYMDTLRPDRANPWDICLKYVLVKAEAGEPKARAFLYDCMNSPTQLTELAAIFCLFYEEGTASPISGSPVARALIHIFMRLGISTLIGAAERGSASVESNSLNHLAQIVSRCIRLESGSRVTFNYVEFCTIAISFMGMACVVEGMVGAVPKVFSVPNNDLLFSVTEQSERSLLGELLRHRGQLNIIASV